MSIQRTEYHTSQADGKTTMKGRGQGRIEAASGDVSLELQVVVVRDFDCDMLGGVPFMKLSNIILDIPVKSIMLSGKHIPYTSNPSPSVPPTVLESQFFSGQQRKEIMLSGDFTSTPISDEKLTSEPRYDWLRVNTVHFDPNSRWLCAYV